VCESIDAQYLRSRWVTGNNVWESCLETAQSLSHLCVHIAAVEGIVRWKKLSTVEVPIGRVVCLTQRRRRRRPPPALSPAALLHRPPVSLVMRE